MVETGLDQLPDHSYANRLAGKRVAALVHHGSVNRELAHAVQILRHLRGVEVPCLFGPEHGVWSTHQDMESVPNAADPYFGVPVFSLYGDSVDSLLPPPGSLDDVDIVVADLLDIGTRYYTYAATIVGMARACAQRGIPLIVLDRPNPIDGVHVEGGVLESQFRSFVGAIDVPHRHGLTMGEVVKFAVENSKIDVDLLCIPAKGWTRDMMAPDTGLPWVPPSPNMPTFEATVIYPGMCLLEATTLSEGRGTTTPFELFGAPGIEPFELSKTLNSMDLPGVGFRPHIFRPMFGKYAGRQCGGAQIVVRSPREVQALNLGAIILHTIARDFPASFGWRSEAYEFVEDIPAIDLLAGDPELRTRIDNLSPLSPLLERWATEAKLFVEARASAL